LNTRDESFEKPETKQCLACALIGLLFLLGLLAGCTEGSNVEPDINSEPEISEGGFIGASDSYDSGNIYLDEVTKPSLLELIKYQKEGSETIAWAYANSKNEEDQAIAKKHEERAKRLGDLQSRVNEIDPNDSAALDSAYNEFHEIPYCLKIKSTRNAIRCVRNKSTRKGMPSLLSSLRCTL
jgi:hypothetical protein